MSTHATRIVKHSLRRCNTARHAKNGDCGTRLEVHCTCGYGQGASCQAQADAIARGHVEHPDLPVISWKRDE